MPRNAKSIGLHLAEGNPNRLTKAEIKRREQSEIKLGGDKMTCPMYVVTDTIAYKKWRDLIADYNKARVNGIDLIKSSDAGILARYCMTHSEYIRLLEMRKHVDAAVINWDEYERFFPLDFRDGINRILKVDPALQIDTAINKKGDMLIKMEDRLFLNPLAKVKNVPKKEEPKADPLGDKGFGNV